MKKGLKVTLITIASAIALVLVFALSYVGYIVLSYSRVGNMELEVTHAAETEVVSLDTVYSISTYNIGFGAYSQNFTFFMDTGYDESGNDTCGYYSKAFSKDDVLTNTRGAIKVIEDLNVDFALFQEVDTKSTRSHKVNQFEMIKEALTGYDVTFAENFHTAFLPYPLYDMHGSVNAGLTSMSKFKVQKADRHEYTVSTSLSKLFDLDRCFSVMEIKVSNDKTLYVVNSHMSAYDKGGTIREQQLKELNAFLKECEQNGNYVIVGGDFNHDLLTYNPDFSYTTSTKPFNEAKKAPDWLAYFFNDKKEHGLSDNYKVVADDSWPTCRNNDIEWEEGKTFTCVVDGFIVSNNIEVVECKNIKTLNGNKGVDGFAYSDHEPVKMQFKLLS